MIVPLGMLLVVVVVVGVSGGGGVVFVVCGRIRETFPELRSLSDVDSDHRNLFRHL